MKDLTENSVIKMNGDGQPVVSSLDIAKAFDRRHTHVLEAIDSLKKSGHLGEPDIRLTSYIDKSNRQSKCYELSEFGFMLACPFIGGEKAKDGQLMIVTEFMVMRSNLNKPLTTAEQIHAVTGWMVEQERKQAEQEKQLAQIPLMQTDLQLIKDQIDHTNHIFHFGDYTSIKAYCNVNKIRLTTSLASKIGKVCTKHCKEYGVRMGRLPCPVYGEVNSYPEDVIKQILMENDFS